MAYTLACRDMGVACDFVARGKTVEETLAKGNEHVKKVHGYTDAQLNDPKMKEAARKLVKKA